jgi:hypothetical protein
MFSLSSSFFYYFAIMGVGCCRYLVPTNSDILLHLVSSFHIGQKIKSIDTPHKNIRLLGGSLPFGKRRSIRRTPFHSAQFYEPKLLLQIRYFFTKK